MKRLKVVFAVCILVVVRIAVCLATDGETTAKKQVESGVADPEELRQRLEKLWADLERPEPAASAALLKFAAQPAASIPFLKAKVVPLKIEPAKVRALLISLRSEKDEVWKDAAEQLAYFDPRLAIDLETLMKEVVDSPARQRMVEILSDRQAGSLAGKDLTLRPAGADGFNFAIPGAWWAEHKVERLNTSPFGTPKPKWTRAVRALALLDHMDTPEATAIIKDMATGHPDAQPTRVAKEMLGKGAPKVP
ncbi:MAG: hypothetical protein K8R36_18280 [Planctomycetales bacterium]|nr:hypothetical protein [Planctomycetales bacterium]